MGKEGSDSSSGFAFGILRKEEMIPPSHLNLGLWEGGDDSSNGFASGIVGRRG